MYKAFCDMGLPVPEPTGAFYMFPDISSTGLSSEEFATQLFQKYNVAVVRRYAYYFARKERKRFVVKTTFQI